MKIEYELAKKLKDAGFPQDGYFDYEFDLARPTLSELIEACGDRFHSLLRYVPQVDEIDLIWRAYGYDDDQITARGKIPEEAVANLWLELNKK